MTFDLVILSLSGGGTNHLEGFNKAGEIFAASANRPDVPDIVVFITDGDASDFADSAAAVSIR